MMRARASGDVLLLLLNALIEFLLPLDEIFLVVYVTALTQIRHVPLLVRGGFNDIFLLLFFFTCHRHILFVSLLLNLWNIVFLLLF